MQKIFGVTAGYNGLSEPEAHEMIELNPQVLITVWARVRVELHSQELIMEGVYPHRCAVLALPADPRGPGDWLGCWRSLPIRVVRQNELRRRLRVGVDASADLSWRGCRPDLGITCALVGAGGTR